jgi:hypothetical protein
MIKLFDCRRFSSASRSLWKFGEDVAGEYHNLDKLSFLVVRNSGHLLPMDLPEVALDMLDRFLNQKPFNDVDLPSEDEYYKKLLLLKSSYAASENFQSSGSTVLIIFGLLITLFTVVLGIVFVNKRTNKETYQPVRLGASFSDRNPVQVTGIQLQPKMWHFPKDGTDAQEEKDGHKFINPNGYQSL